MDDLATEVVKNQSTNAPEIQRRKRRQPEERGLPTDEALKDLATTYLQSQSRMWPKLVGTEALQKPTPVNITKLANEFKQRFLTKEIGQFAAPTGQKAALVIGAAYVRYSDAKSNPRSLDQQLQRCLDWAQRNGVFIPASHVYFDAAVTATTAQRHGYQMAKKALEQHASVKFLMVDELGRASREMVETLLLGRLVECLGRRLVSVSDGFDTDSPMGKLMLSIFAALHEWFVDQLHSKVNRGMDDAFDRGTNTGVPALGYVLVPAKDGNGHPMFGKDGMPAKMLVIDPQGADYVLLAFELFGDKGWSRGRIARHFA